MTKQCAKCKRVYEHSEFYRQNRAKDGLDPYHKDCRKQVTLEYAKSHRERLNEQQREWYHRNKDRINANRKSK